MKIIEWLKGKKTYIVMLVGVIVNGLVAMNLIPAEYLGAVNSVLVFLGLGAIRAGVNNK